MSWLVHRICKDCGRKFDIVHTAGDHMPNHCPECSMISGDVSGAFATAVAREFELAEQEIRDQLWGGNTPKLGVECES